MTHVAVEMDARSTQAAGLPLRVLIADDSAEIRRAVNDLLAEEAHVEVVGEAENAAAAVRLTHELEPDALILDVNMPDRSGIWVLRTLQREQVESEVVVLTNHGSDFYRRKCLEAGALAFFDKHTEFGSVATALRMLVAQRR